MKRCSRCGELKPLDDFAWRRKARNQRQSYCRPCNAHYQSEHYRANRAQYIDRARIRNAAVRLERIEFLLEYFTTHPCVDCGERDPVVLEFDHLTDKLFTIGTELAYRSWKTVLDEIAKCEVVCANCHRRRSMRRSRALRVVMTGVQSQR